MFSINTKNLFVKVWLSARLNYCVAISGSYLMERSLGNRGYAVQSLSIRNVKLTPAAAPFRTLLYPFCGVPRIAESVGTEFFSGRSCVE